MATMVSGSPYSGGIIGDSQLRCERTNIQGTLRRRALVKIGAAGAPTLSPTGTTFGITRSKAGTYAVTFPQQGGSADNAYLKAGVALSTLPTVRVAVITAFNPAAGTATFTTVLDASATPVDPANGDMLWMELVSDDTGSQ